MNVCECIFYGKVQSNQSVNASTKRSEPLKKIVDQNMAKTKSLIKQPRLHSNLCPTAKPRVLQKIDGFLCSLAIIWQWHKASLRHKDTSHPRPSSVTSLFWDGALWNWDKQSLKKKISSNIMLDWVKWSEMHYGLAWVVRDFPTNVWALVAGLSLLMLPSLFRSLDACRGVHLEKSRHEMTWERSQGTTIDGTSLKNRKVLQKNVPLLSWIYHNQGTDFSDPTSINTSFWSAPAFASPDATCPGTVSTSPFNKIIQWRLKEKEIETTIKANWSKRPQIPDSPFTTSILPPLWMGWQDSEALKVTGGPFKDHCSNLVILPEEKL